MKLFERSQEYKAGPEDMLKRESLQALRGVSVDAETLQEAIEKTKGMAVAGKAEKELVLNNKNSASDAPQFYDGNRYFFLADPDPVDGHFSWISLDKAPRTPDQIDSGTDAGHKFRSEIVSGHPMDAWDKEHDRVVLKG